MEDKRVNKVIKNSQLHSSNVFLKNILLANNFPWPTFSLHVANI